MLESTCLHGAFMSHCTAVSGVPTCTPFLYDSGLSLQASSLPYSSFHYQHCYIGFFRWSQTLANLLFYQYIQPQTSLCAPCSARWFSVTFSTCSNSVRGIMFTGWTRQGREMNHWLVSSDSQNVGKERIIVSSSR